MRPNQRRRARVAVLVALVLASLAATLFARQRPRTNVVLIIADDLGYGDLSSYGAPCIRTPHLDRLAQGGVRMTSVYANAPVCTPTRAALITGRYQQRVLLERPLRATANEGLAVTGRALPQLLKHGGYATGLGGKWHLARHEAVRPLRHGFDYCWGYLAGYIDWYTHTNSEGEADLWQNTSPVQIGPASRTTRSWCSCDNGGEWLSRNAPFFHRKDSLWEGGIRVPAILRWPSVPPKGVTADQVGITMDITATILAATGTPITTDLRLEGRDLIPILSGKEPLVERTLFWRNTLNNHTQRAVRVGEWKLPVDGEGEFLFNLRDDSGERNDVATTQFARVRALKTLSDAWVKDVDAGEVTLSRTPGSAVVNGPRRAHNPWATPGPRRVTVRAFGPRTGCARARRASAGRD